MKVKVRLVLMHQGRTEHDFETTIEKPIIGEIITMHGDLHYTIDFLQYMFDENKKYKYILVTGIKR